MPSRLNASPNEADSGGFPFLALYVHVPFCRVKCEYCAFCSAPPGPGDVPAYLTHLEADFRKLAKDPLCTKIKTVFVGGGNPTILDPPELESLVTMMTGALVSARIMEWTFESNPETLDREKAGILSRVPELRLSLGLQRLRKPELDLIGRKSTPEKGREALSHAFGVTGRVGIDLILGVPGCDSLAADLGALVREFPLEHVSSYFLTPEENTPLWGKIRQNLFPDPAEVGPEELFEVADVLEWSGFEQYEISNFARPGGRCRHNENYWRGGTYIGLGPSAVGTIDNRRSTSPSGLQDWISGKPGDVENLDEEALRKEWIMLRLRLTADGLDLGEYENRFGSVSEAFRNSLARQVELGLLESAGSAFRLTRSGIVCANQVISSLF